MIPTNLSTRSGAPIRPFGRSFGAVTSRCSLDGTPQRRLAVTIPTLARPYAHRAARVSLRSSPKPEMSLARRRRERVKSHAFFATLRVLELSAARYTNGLGGNAVVRWTTIPAVRGQRHTFDLLRRRSARRIGSIEGLSTHLGSDPSL